MKLIQFAVTFQRVFQRVMECVENVKFNNIYSDDGLFKSMKRFMSAQIQVD